MSLKIEQKLDQHFFTQAEPRIFTTGAYLVPMQIVVDGKQRYVWVVDEFEDETYNDEGLSVSPNVYADNLTALLNEEE